MRPNFILAMADDQGWGDMAYMGNELVKTPNFDAMAKDSCRLDRFYAAAPVCSPTRGSVLTGRHPNRFGCFQWGNTLRPQETTIAEVMQKAGYRTGHFGKWHLGSLRPASRVNPGASGFDEWFSNPNFFDNDPWMSRNGVPEQVQGESSILTADAAIDFIREAHANNQPFLAVVWFGSPHIPHQGSAEDLAQYRKDLPSAKRNFLAEVSGMDRAMGKIRDFLREEGIEDNTVLWFNSDNGAIPQGSTGGLRGKKGTLWEGGIRVPALVEWPGHFPPSRSEVPCGTVDIFPTLLELAGVKPEHLPPLDGESLAALLEGKPFERHNPLGFWSYPAAGNPVRGDDVLAEIAREQASGQKPVLEDSTEYSAEMQYPLDQFPGHSAWIDGDWKLHRIEDEQGQVTWELYNLATDPAETTDGLHENSKISARMKNELKKWLVSVVRSLNGADYSQKSTAH